MLLHEFLVEHRAALIDRCRAKVLTRLAPRPTDPELKHGVPLFLDQLTRILRLAQTHGGAGDVAPGTPSEIGDSAASHGHELLRHGFTVNQVVHDYGDLCQAVTELAVERRAEITTDEFRTLNLCLDNAIAAAVTEYGRERERITTREGIAAANERLGFLAHEFGNLLNSALLAFDAVKSGNVGVSGATGALLHRSLLGLRSLVHRSLADVRLTAGLPHATERISIGELFDEAQLAAAMEASARGISFTVVPVHGQLFVHADRQLLHSAIANLLQNAFKFTRPGGHVRLEARGADARVNIEVADECGGLPPGKAEELFRSFEQRGDDRSGLGLGLSISRQAVEANGGKLGVRNAPGHGCTFTIELPRGSMRG